ncbi:hypothetical protein BC943DRAFT_321452 [Umbelopsis sp. AD052]|nr:hypothetical protein BC943DRAFT_321452 [Umbelopsis sp. AD052]
MKITNTPQERFSHFDKHVDRTPNVSNRNQRPGWTRSRCKSPFSAEGDAKQHSVYYNKKRRRTPPSLNKDDLTYHPTSAFSDEYLLDLRRKAFKELHVQTQAYNDSFVARMQYMESLPQEEQRHLWGMLTDPNESPNDKDTQAVLEIIDMLERNTVNDYGAYLERLQTLDDSPSSPEHDVGDFW